MRPLSATDNVFLALERPHQPMHVAGLFVFEADVARGRDFVAQLLRRYRSFDRPTAPFGDRLVLGPLGYAWQEDKHFDIENHVRHAALPSPGGAAELDAWVAAQHETPLHRERPLWEVHLIEGLAGGEFAIYAKVHHALLDGVSALRRALTGFTPDAQRADAPPLWASDVDRKHRSNAAVPDLGEILTKLAHQAQAQLASLPVLARELGRMAIDVVAHMDDPESVEPGPSPFAGRITSARRFGAMSYTVPRIEALAQALCGTLNDAALAICAGALRGYLSELALLPSQPIVAMVPVSLRHGGAGRGNRIAMILANLATHTADVGERVHLLQTSVRATKNRYSAMTEEEIVGLTALTLTPTFLSVVTRARVPHCAFQVVISNVPGPKQELFLDGARLRHVHPVSIVVDHVALNITFTSYAGALDFGIVACRHAVPDMERLKAHFDLSLAELEAHFGLAEPDRSVAPQSSSGGGGGGGAVPLSAVAASRVPASGSARGTSPPSPPASALSTLASPASASDSEASRVSAASLVVVLGTAAPSTMAPMSGEDPASSADPGAGLLGVADAGRLGSKFTELAGDETSAQPPAATITRLNARV